jgi:hypothetical protein
VVGVVLGILVLGETVSWNEPVGALVVFLGILLAQDRLRRRGNGKGTDDLDTTASRSLEPETPASSVPVPAGADLLSPAAERPAGRG